MRVQLVGVLRGIQADVFASHHLMCIRRGKSHVVNKLRPRDRFLTLTGFIKAALFYCHLSQEVQLRVLVKRRHGTSGPKPRIYSYIVFISFAKAAIIGEADVFLQLRYLRQHQSNKITPRGHLRLIRLTEQRLVSHLNICRRFQSKQHKNYSISLYTLHLLCGIFSHTKECMALRQQHWFVSLSKTLDQTET